MSRPASLRLSKSEKTRAVASPNQTTPAALATLPDSTGPPELSDDLLFGADQIAAFIFGAGDPGRRKRRRVYGLIDAGQLPVFRLASTVCARKSSILKIMHAREQAALEAILTPAE